MRIRYRIDGVLHEVMRSPRNIQNGMISRLKVMADINIAERRIPQDGRISTTIDGPARGPAGGHAPDGLRREGRHADPGQAPRRTCVCPTSASYRTTCPGTRPSYTKPYGTILVTGPTGSGKSTTLYATLNILNQDTKNVITVEDPVEYQLDGINQVQVNNKAGLTFASALRTILRADPDIILVGEIRDRETASDRRRGRPDRPPGAVHPAHQRRRHDPEPARRNGCRAVPRRQRPRLHRRPALGS